MYPQQTSAAVGARKMRVVGVVEETHDARSILVEPHPEHIDAFDYRPGQFLTVRVPDVGSGTARCYSLSSSPHVDSTMKFTVKRVAGGHGSNWLCDEIALGDELEVLPPAGTFTVRSLDQSVVLVAGGSGITPVIAIAKSILHAGTGTVLLVYANRDERSVIFGEQLRELGERFGSRFTVIHVLESVQGYLTAPAMSNLIRPFTDRAVYICGPEPLMKLVKAVCSAEGIAPSQVMTERFVSLSTDPFRNPVEDKPSTSDTGVEVSAQDEAAAGDCTVHVSLDGTERTVAWPRSKRLLDALLDAGVEAPFSCREGACSACVCSLTEGEVRLVRNEVLEADDLADGYILACQAEVVTDQISIKY
ncbi:oxygenase reductase KshB (plasmid) [Rhodococcus jostii RHA1]|uniref:Oxygenase reductase KshB n=1 Tax=Rhodococcus jostii (strain RHA1) TaxID=101510 RepID=Q0RXE0_RHOJR|nr:ferredoxin--NADP reductase [Rhodococcus jostii]ABH00046.1 oxygenase reductase KshB [Rhodococcus jostii RHA1]